MKQQQLSVTLNLSIQDTRKVITALINAEAALTEKVANTQQVADSSAAFFGDLLPLATADDVARAEQQLADFADISKVLSFALMDAAYSVGDPILSVA